MSNDTRKMREALECVLKQYGTRKEEDCFEDHGDCEVCAGKNDLCWIEETARKVRDALASPPRNCDLYATADEAMDAFEREGCPNDCCDCPYDTDPPTEGSCPDCEVNWLFSTATPEKGGAK